MKIAALSLSFPFAVGALFVGGVLAANPISAGGGPPAFFTDSFDSGAFLSSLENGGRVFAFAKNPAGDSVVHNTAGNRNYVRTIASDYNTRDFRFRLDVDTRGFTGGDSLIYIGLGDATPYNGFYQEPGLAIGFHLHADPNDNHGTQYVVRQNFDKEPDFRRDPGRSTTLTRPDGTPGGLTEKGLYTVQIEKRGDALTFTIFRGLYFGANNPSITFDNLRVEAISQNR